MIKSTTTPMKPVDLDGDDRWMSQHERQLVESKEKEPDVVFLGDSIIQNLEQRTIWEDYFEPLHSLNFGISPATTQNILWRIENGLLNHLEPKVVVLHIGTYNEENNPVDIADGIVKITEEIHEKLRSAKIMVLELLPRGHKPNPLRERNDKVNKILREKFSEVEYVELMPVEETIVQPDGLISHHDMLDYLIPTEVGYRKIFDSIYSSLLDLLVEYRF